VSLALRLAIYWNLIGKMNLHASLGRLLGITRLRAIVVARQRAVLLFRIERSTQDGVPPRVSTVSLTLTGASPGPWQARNCSVSPRMAARMDGFRKQHMDFVRWGQVSATDAGHAATRGGTGVGVEAHPLHQRVATTTARAMMFITS